MNTLFGILNHPLTHRIGWALLHSLWQGALVGAVFALLRFALRNRSANARYLAGCLSLGLLSAFPVLTLLVGPLPSAAPDSEATAISAFQKAAAPVVILGDIQNSHALNATYSFWHQSADILGQAAPLLAAAWLLGVAFFSARLTRSWWWVRNIRHRDNEPLEPAWMETLNDLRRRLGVSRSVCLLKSALVEVPTVIGWFHPAILLPVATLTGLTPSQVEALLAHELAHVRRLDYVVNAFQCFVETLMFYHPVAWWISRYIREERENCCDDLVIQVCADRLVYARALAAMEGLRGKLPNVVFAASGGSLLNRIRRLLGVSYDNGSVSARQVGSLALMGICLVVIVLVARLALGSTTHQPITVRYITSDGFNDNGHPLNGTVFWATNHTSNTFDAWLSAIEVKTASNWVVQARPMERLVFQASGNPVGSIYLNPHAAGYATPQLSTQPTGTTWRARVLVRPMLSGIEETAARLKGTPRRLLLRFQTGETNIPMNPFSTGIHVFGKGGEVVSQEISDK